MDKANVLICKECDLSSFRDGYCAGHYMKVYRYGTPYPIFPPRHSRLFGQRFDQLVVIGRSNGKWLCKCDCGEFSWRMTGGLKRGARHSCGGTIHRRGHPRYGLVHDWIIVERGSARDHSCVDCDGQAAHWSYDHGDPGERFEDNPQDEAYGLPYSLKSEHYHPRCARCHKRFDLRPTF